MYACHDLALQIHKVVCSWYSAVGTLQYQLHMEQLGPLGSLAEGWLTEAALVFKQGLL